MDSKKVIGLVFISFILVLLISSMVLGVNEKDKTYKTDEKLIEKDKTYKTDEKLIKDVLKGKVEFVDNIKSENYTATELLNTIVIEDNYIYIDSDTYPELNKKARIFFYNTGITDGAYIVNDGYFCDDCVPVKYGDDDWYLDVKHFSYYNITKTEFNGTFDNAYLDDGTTLMKKPLASLIWTGRYNSFADESHYQIPTDNDTESNVILIADSNARGGYYANFTEDSWFSYLGQIPIRASPDNINMTFVVSIANYTKAGSTNRIFAKNAEYTIGFGKNFYLNSWGEIDNIIASDIPANDWSMQTIWWEETQGLTAYVNGSNLYGTAVMTDTSGGTGNPLLVGNPGAASNAFAGQLEYMFIFRDEFVDGGMLDYFYNNDVIPKYYKRANYTTTVEQATIYYPETEVNLFEAVNLTSGNGPITYVNVYGRAGECATLSSQSWTLGTKNGNNYAFSGLSGECYQALLEFEGDYNYSDNVTGISFESTKFYKPAVDTVNIHPVAPVAVGSVYGNATYLLNDSDDGTVLFKWFVNAVNVYNSSTSGLSNGSIATSTLIPFYTEVGDTIYFTATPSNAQVTGDTVTSSSVVVANSGFTLVNYTNNTNKINLTEPQKTTFEIELSDPDGDVNITWYVNGDYTHQGSTFIYRTWYKSQGTNTILAVMSDGTNSQEVQWVVDVTDVDVMQWALPLMFGFLILLSVFAGLLLFLEQKHTVIKLMSFLLIPFILVGLTGFMINVADVSGLITLKGIFRGLFNAMIGFTIFSIAYVIIYFIKEVLESIDERRKERESSLIK